MPVVFCYVWDVPGSFYGWLFPCLTQVLAYRCLVNEDDREVPSFRIFIFTRIKLHNYVLY
ncbi:hypothetical protein Hanom_Chr06g00505401 [Helianthus anomalus]